MIRALAGFGLALLAVGAAACSDDDPVDATGTWTVSTTNRENGCAYQSWKVGAQGSSTITIAQTGSAVTGTVSGFAALVLDVWLGSHSFTGSVDGSHVTMTLDGRGTAKGSCAYNIRAVLSAIVIGNTIDAGRIDYVPHSNGDSDCGVLIGCTSWQEFSGSRPPPAH